MPQVQGMGDAPGGRGPGGGGAGGGAGLERVTLEVRVAPDGLAGEGEVREAVARLVQREGLRLTPGPLEWAREADAVLDDNVEGIEAVWTGAGSGAHEPGALLLFWELELQVCVYRLSREGPAEEVEGDDGVASFWEWPLPCVELQGLWGSLHFESGVQNRLLRYAESALYFSHRGVDPCLVSWNRLVLLYGPPGTGKTSLCKALAQKLSIRLRTHYPEAFLLEINAHSLFSKWFSESGKLVSKLFGKIQEMVEEEGSLVFVLLDEVESLTAARAAAVSGNEPSDAIRAVNSLLTHLDALKAYPNAVVMATSNITEAVDVAFLDRADIKAFIGPPGLQARYQILRSCVNELHRAGIVDTDVGEAPAGASSGGEDHGGEEMEEDRDGALEQALWEVCKGCEGMSGRLLRKLPFLAHASDLAGSCTTAAFLQTMRSTAERELRERGHSS